MSTDNLDLWRHTLMCPYTRLLSVTRYIIKSLKLSMLRRYDLYSS